MDLPEPYIAGTIIIGNEWLEHNGGVYRIDVKISYIDKTLKWYTPAILSEDGEKIIVISRDLDTKREAVKLAKHAIDNRLEGVSEYQDDYLYSHGSDMKYPDDFGLEK